MGTSYFITCSRNKFIPTHTLFANVCTSQEQGARNRVWCGTIHPNKDWQRLDVYQMESLPTGKFDCVVVYGEPLSYIMEKRGDALTECIRVWKLQLKQDASIWAYTSSLLLKSLADSPCLRHPLGRIQIHRLAHFLGNISPQPTGGKHLHLRPPTANPGLHLLRFSNVYGE